jgi:hypothetical protein
MTKNISLYSDAGVNISKSSINIGDKVTVSYDGLLAKSGADTIFLHYGYGDSWEQKDFIQMENKEGIFGATLKAVSAGSLNISFKDSADNWDNNSAENYSFIVLKKENALVEAKESTKVKKAAKKPASDVKLEAKTSPKKSTSKTKTLVEK